MIPSSEWKQKQWRGCRTMPVDCKRLCQNNFEYKNVVTGIIVFINAMDKST